MNYYDTMQVCKKWGHQITAFYETSSKTRKKYCDRCGSVTIIKCEKCQEKIRGYYHQDYDTRLFGTSTPPNCHNCGNPYPWKMWVTIKDIWKTISASIKYVIDSIVSIFKRS